MPLPQDGNEISHGDDERRRSEDCQDKTIQGNPPLFPRRLGEHRLLVAPVYQISNMCSSMFWSALLGGRIPRATRRQLRTRSAFGYNRGVDERSRR